MGKEGQGFLERHARARREIIEQEWLVKQMSRLELSKKDIDDFRAEKGAGCRCIELTPQPLTLGFSQWKQVDEKGGPLLRATDFLSPFNWTKISFGKQGIYSELKLRAIELGASAIIEYKQEVEGKKVTETGKPVKIIRDYP